MMAYQFLDNDEGRFRSGDPLLDKIDDAIRRARHASSKDEMEQALHEADLQAAQIRDEGLKRRIGVTLATTRRDILSNLD